MLSRPMLPLATDNPATGNPATDAPATDDLTQSRHAGPAERTRNVRTCKGTSGASCVSRLRPSPSPCCPGEVTFTRSGEGDESAQEPDPHRWWALVVIALAQLMVVLDATVVTIALPSAQRALHISAGNRQ